MASDWRVVASYIRLHLKTAHEYRVDLILRIADSVVVVALQFTLLWLILSQFGQLVGWSLHEVAFLWSLRLMSHGLYVLVFSPVSLTTSDVRTGNFDRWLTRPIDPLFQMILANLDLLGYVDIGIGVALFVTSLPPNTLEPGVAWLIYVPLVILSGAMGEAAIWIAVSALAFLIIDTGALQWALSELWQFTQYPMHIFDQAVRFLLVFVIPFALFSYYPAALLLGKLPTGSVLSLVVYGIPIAGPCLFVLAWKLWHLCLRLYQSTGS